MKNRSAIQSQSYNFFNYIPISFFANILQLSEYVFIHICCYLKITNCFA
nr:MAG TPA: hypothetical protein [Caudoviricetes sp.]